MNRQLPAAPLEEFRLRDYLNILVRRVSTFFVTFLAVVAAVLLFTFFQPPLYESTATLFVKDGKGPASQAGSFLANAAAPVVSELEILRSRSNAEKVVATLHLDWKVDKRSEGLAFKLDHFSSRARVPVYSVLLSGGGGYTVRDADGSLVGTGRDGEVLQGRDVTLLIKELKGRPGDSFRITLLPFHQTVHGLRREVKAAEVGKNTNVISVSYRNRDAVLARDVVNALVQAYLYQGIAIKAEESTRTIAFIEEQLQGIRAELDGAEKNLESYKSASGVIQLDAEANNLIQTLSDAEKRKIETTLQRKQVEFALGSLKKAWRNGTLYSPAVMRDDQMMAVMASRLAELEVQKRGLLSESTEIHPGVKGVQAQIDELQRRIQATYESHLKGLQKQEYDVSGEIARQDAQLKRLPAAERDLARLMRVSKVNADIYTFLLQKHEEARIAKASTISSINVVDPAIAADRPVWPDRGKNVNLALIAGVLCGIALCFFREYLDDTLKDPEQMKRVLALPLLAVIPSIPNKRCDPALASHETPTSTASEAFRSLRTSLQFCPLGNEKQVILVTSTFPGEGKTTVASNLAIILAQSCPRVLIVDGDLRRSTLHRKLGLPRGEGLTELLAGQLRAAAAIQASQVNGLDLLQAGSSCANPADLLGSGAMATLIQQMRKVYSHIVIDATSILAVTDAPLLTQVSDLVILVLEPGRVPAKAALRARELLEAAATPVAGIVVAGKNAGAAGYGYDYDHDYRPEEEQKRSWWRWKGRDQL